MFGSAGKYSVFMQTGVSVWKFPAQSSDVDEVVVVYFPLLPDLVFPSRKFAHLFCCKLPFLSIMTFPFLPSPLPVCFQLKRNLISFVNLNFPMKFFCIFAYVSHHWCALLNSELTNQCNIFFWTERMKSTLNIETSACEIEERGVKLKLTVVDTPGFGDGINNSEWLAILVLI